MPSKSRSGRSSKSSAQKDSISKSSSSAVTTSATSSATTSDNLKSKGLKKDDTTLLNKVIQPGYELSPEEALAAAHWIRQLTALFLGLIFGFLQLNGFPPIMTYCAVSFTVPYSVLSNLHELDLEEINTKGTIQTEGFFPATALFFLSWIISYTAFLPAST